MAKRSKSPPEATKTKKKPRSESQSDLYSFLTRPNAVAGSSTPAKSAAKQPQCASIDLGGAQKNGKARNSLKQEGKKPESREQAVAGESSWQEEIVLDDSDDSEDDCIIVDEKQNSVASTSTAPAPIPLATPKPKSAPPPTLFISTASPSFLPKTSGAFFSSTAPEASTSGPSKSLNTSIFAFDPKRDVNTSSWNAGRVPYAYLVDAFVLISSTKSRLTILQVLTNFLRVVIELDESSLLEVLYLITNRLGPPHSRGLDLGIGHQVLTKSLVSISGLSSSALRSLSHKLGDPGDVAFEATKGIRVLIRPTPLACHSLYKNLLSVTKMKGRGAQLTKTNLVKKLLVAAQGEEIRFLVRTLSQNLRIGAVRLTLSTALARAFCLSMGKEARNDGFWLSAGERQTMERSEARRSGAEKGRGEWKEEEEELLRDATEKMSKAEALVRKVYARHPDYSTIIKSLLATGLENLDSSVPLAVGTPLQAMLGVITRSLSEVFTRLGTQPFVSEAKLDGQRGQIHVSVEVPEEGGTDGVVYESGGKKIWVRLFSRHLEDMTEKYPDFLPTLFAIVERSQLSPTPLTSFIIDSEVVAIDPITGALRSFQELSYRSKKDVQLEQIKVRVGVYAFDLMFLNGKSLLSETFRKRRELLQSLFPPLLPPDGRSAKWELVPSCEDNSLVAVQKFFRDCLALKAEGIMCKLLDQSEMDEVEEETTSSPRKRTRKILGATYEPDQRAESWLKVKKDYMDGTGDSLDLVPLGAWHGSGRKKGWWSPILLGCYDEETGGWSAVCKIISGFKDSFYQDLSARYSVDGEITSRIKYSDVEAANLTPSIWFKPSEVWEIRGADFTLSPVYPAAIGLVSEERGISIRFPRFMKLREDKGAEQATTVQQLANLFSAQGRDGHGMTMTKEGGEEEEEEEDG